MTLTREEIIGALKDFIEGMDLDETVTVTVPVLFLKDVGRLLTIDEMPTVGGWISVKERLPEKSGTYLCYQPKAADICALNTVRYSTQRGWMGKEYGSRIEGIEYWMPLPEPPEEARR